MAGKGAEGTSSTLPEGPGSDDFGGADAAGDVDEAEDITEA